MKILHIVDYLMPQIGYQEFLLPKWNAIHGHEVHILTSDRYNPVPNYKNVWGDILGERICGSKVQNIDNINIIRLPTIEFFRRPWLIHLRGNIKKINPDIIWVHGTASPSSFRMALFCKNNGYPLIMDNHQHFIAARKGILGTIYYYFLKQISKFFLAKPVNKFIGLSDECVDFMSEMQNLPKDKMTVCPYGVDTNIFYNDNNLKIQNKIKLNIPENAVIVMQTGKLDQTRHPDWLAKAMIPLMKKNPSLWLLFLGNSSLKDMDNLKNILSDNDIKQRTIFHPFVKQNELINFYNTADICVYPDSCSLSCLEASACECATIVNNLPVGIEREKNCVVKTFERGNILDLTNSINQFIENPTLRINFGKQARENVKKLYSYHFVASLAENIMQEIISNFK